MRKVEVMVNLIEAVKAQGVTGVGLCWTFFSRRIQPLKTRVHHMWEYSDYSDPMRESREELAHSEIAARVVAVLEMNVATAMSVFDSHPLPRSLSNELPNVSPPSRLCFCYAYCQPPFLSNLYVCFSPWAQFALTLLYLRTRRERKRQRMRLSGSGGGKRRRTRSRRQRH
ncbi:hypothetical protein BAE44_0008293 [Dichanthelium oligosanthes]|uniref:Uncharacterized protein n=1 Tax=Dichanthelium oligosanthes TaxID=888268 RepID=A0A1E5W032_9POAL|nr:hypothetical protein BAE44_0008293 [Dichanthelium oligosanthes]